MGAVKGKWACGPGSSLLSHTDARCVLSAGGAFTWWLLVPDPVPLANRTFSRFRGVWGHQMWLLIPLLIVWQWGSLLASWASVSPVCKMGALDQSILRPMPTLSHPLPQFGCELLGVGVVPACPSLPLVGVCRGKGRVWSLGETALHSALVGVGTEGSQPYLLVSRPRPRGHVFSLELS